VETVFRKVSDWRQFRRWREAHFECCNGTRQAKKRSYGSGDPIHRLDLWKPADVYRYAGLLEDLSRSLTLIGPYRLRIPAQG